MACLKITTLVILSLLKKRKKKGRMNRKNRGFESGLTARSTTSHICKIVCDQNTVKGGSEKYIPL